MPSKRKISKVDELHYKIIRKNVSDFIQKCEVKYDKTGQLLDIAPQIHEGAAPYFKKMKISTLDIDSSTNPTYVADICKNNKKVIPNNNFDFVVCTEVLEHVLDPFAAVEEIHRILKSKGLLFVTTPFNFRIHGPLPDRWRFTEYGLRTLLKKFKIISLDQVESKKRWLMPIHYSVVARK